MPEGVPATILSAMRWAGDVLSKGRIDEARLTAELLMCHVLSCKRMRLYLDHDKILNTGEQDLYVSLIRRRLAHEPVQYITGEANFMGLEFLVDPRVLIPRPETEVLVEEMLLHSRRRGKAPTTILDVGVGSGNIAVTLAHFLPTVSVVGMDISTGALEVASENVRRHNVSDKVSLLHSDIIADALPLRDGRFHAIVSNPPYIPAADVAGLDPEVRLFEPGLATTDGADGLTFYRKLARLAVRLLEPGGLIMVETSYNQARIVEGIFRENDIGELKITADLSGIERIVEGRRCGP